MNFSIKENFSFQSSINSYINNYKTINSVSIPIVKTDNFVVGTDNCFICSSITGKIYIVLPPAHINKGRTIVFINQTENELISVDSLTSLNQLYNVFYLSPSSTILNSYSSYFCMLVSDGLFWYRMN